MAGFESATHCWHLSNGRLGRGLLPTVRSPKRVLGSGPVARQLPLSEIPTREKRLFGVGVTSALLSSFSVINAPFSRSAAALLCESGSLSLA